MIVAPRPVFPDACLCLVMRLFVGGFCDRRVDDLIGRYKIRIQQQRIHAEELSGDLLQQKHARAQLAGIIAGLAKLQDLRKQFT